MKCYAYCVAAILLIQTTIAAKILLLPTMMKSHVMELLSIGEEMFTRGHQVSIYLPTSFDSEFVNSSLVNVITYNVHDEYRTMSENGAAGTQIGSWKPRKHMFDKMFYLRNFTKGMCWGLFSDKKRIEYLAKEKFDLAIVTTLPITQCLFYLPYYLNISTIAEGAHIIGKHSRMPFQGNTLPYLFSSFGADMNFLERIANSFQHILSSLFMSYFILPDMSKYDPSFSEIDADTLAQRSILFIENNDYIFDYPKATFPNFVNVGGLTAKPAKVLGKTLEEFISSSPKGIVFVSFGTVAPFEFAPKSMVENMLTALRQLNYNVLMKARTDYDDGNIKFAKWLPQNDILGHPKTKLFISHCGKNGIYESLYHGVPILCSPRSADQPMNAKRVEKLAIGINLNFQYASLNEISTAIDDVIHNETYRKNMQRLSRMFHDRPESPAQRAASAIEHVIKYGSNHMTSPSAHFTTLQYVSADIWFAVYSFLFLSVYTVWKCCQRVVKSVFTLTQTKLKVN